MSQIPQSAADGNILYCSKETSLGSLERSALSMHPALKEASACPTGSIFARPIRSLAFQASSLSYPSLVLSLTRIHMHIYHYSVRYLCGYNQSGLMKVLNKEQTKHQTKKESAHLVMGHLPYLWII